MRITGPHSVPVAQLRDERFRTRTGPPPQGLVRSIKEEGIKEPLLVAPEEVPEEAPEEDSYHIVDGFQRYTVAKNLGFLSLPALVLHEAREAELHEIALLRNSLQTSLAPIEKALYLRKLKDDYDYPNGQLARLLGVQKSYVSELFLIFRLGDWAVGQLRQQKHFTVAHARLLARCEHLTNPAHQDALRKLIRRIKREHWSLARLRYELRNRQYLQEENPYRINVDGLFSRLNQSLNHSQGQYSRTLEIHFDDLWELRQKLLRASHLLSRFTEFLPPDPRRKKD